MKKPASFDRALAVNCAKLIDEAYWMFEHDTSGTAQPAPRSPFPVKGYKFVTWVQMKDFILFNPNPPYVFYGMIAQNTSEPNKFVLAIRGTDSLAEILDDLTAWELVDWENFGQVGFCFSEIYKTLRIVPPIPTPAVPPMEIPRGTFAHQVAAVVKHTAAAQGVVERDVSVVVTGHSLGAALGTLYVAQNIHAKLLTNPLHCTFGSPQVGDSKFVRNFNRLRMRSWRIVNEYDIIPMLPPEILGFRHVKGLHLNKMTVSVVPTPVCFHHKKPISICSIRRNRFPKNAKRAARLDARNATPPPLKSHLPPLKPSPPPAVEVS
jgi:lipase (class 3)